MTKPIARGADRRRLPVRHAISSRTAAPTRWRRAAGATSSRSPTTTSRPRHVRGQLHARRAAVPGLSVEAARRTHLRAAGLLAQRDQTVDRLKEITPIPDDPRATTCARSGTSRCVNCHATNLVRNYDVADEACLRDYVDGDGDRLRGVPWAWRRAHRHCGRVGTNPSSDADADRHDRQLLHFLAANAVARQIVRRLRLLSRQQEQRFFGFSRAIATRISRCRF